MKRSIPQLASTPPYLGAVAVIIGLVACSPSGAETQLTNTGLALTQGVNVPSNSVVEPDAWFPRTHRSDKGRLVIFTPQIESWEDFKALKAWAAFQIAVIGSGREPYGSLKFEAQTDVDLSKREVLLYNVKILELSIPGVQDYEIEYTTARDAFLSRPKKVPLDVVIQYLPRTLPVSAAKGLCEEPPPIYVSTQPALLLMVDSQPAFLPVGAGDLEFAINANWDLFRQKGTNRYNLLSGSDWLSATSLEGPWSWATSLPTPMATLPDNPNWREARKALPEDVSKLQTPAGKPPLVFYTTKPSELIQFQGEPRWEAIGTTRIEVAINTSSDCFRHEGRIYFLAAGRWFQAATLNGPWTLSKQLPEAFQSIPADHARGYVRSSIPGTAEAWEAALVATIPQTAKVDRKYATELAPQVTYSGEPAFQPIEGTSISMAINTSYQVLKHGQSYYLCYNAVWFQSPNPSGPWEFADKIPGEFSKIPPSSPAHNTTYVKVEESTPQSVVYSSTSGYENSYVTSEGTVVNGSGFVQSAVAVWLAVEILEDAEWYVHPYYPWRPTYGYGSWYDPSSGRYGEAVVGYGPYGGARSAAVYNPETGAYARGQAVWDSDEWAGRSYAYNPNTDKSIGRRSYYGFENNEGWSQRVSRRGDEWIYSESEWQDGHLRTDLETSRGGEGTVNRQRDGDQTTGAGSLTTGGGHGISTEFSRQRQGDEIVTERTISGEKRSARVSGSIEDGKGSFQVSGSGGGTGTVEREAGNGQITGSGSFTKNEKTIETGTSRTAEGVTREFQSSSGGQAKTARQGDERGFVAESGSGDMYAGRDGEVYKKTENGWEQVQPAQNATRAQERSSAVSMTHTSRDASNSKSSAKLNTQSSAQASASATRNASSRGSRNSIQAGSSRTAQLERDHQSRQRGYRKYESFQRSGSLSAGRFGGRGRR